MDKREGSIQDRLQDGEVGVVENKYEILGCFGDRITMVLLRHYAHEAFDPIWKDGYMSRNKAYKWLTMRFFTSKSVHFASMTNKELIRAIRISKHKHKDLMCRAA